MNKDLGNHSKDRLFHSVQLVEYIPTSERERDKARIHEFGKKVFPGIFQGYVLIAVVIWKGDILIADIEDLGKLDASEIYSRRLNAKEVLITKKMETLYFLWQMVQQNYQEETTNSKNPELTVRRESLSGESRDEREEFRPEERKDDAGIHREFWSIQRDFIYRHHIEPRVQFFVPREESIPIPLKNTDVTRVNLYRFGRWTRKTNG